jgi:hypothetical protein
MPLRPKVRLILASEANSVWREPATRGGSDKLCWSRWAKGFGRQQVKLPLRLQRCLQLQKRFEHGRAISPQACNLADGAQPVPSDALLMRQRASSKHGPRTPSLATTSPEPAGATAMMRLVADAVDSDRAGGRERELLASQASARQLEPMAASGLVRNNTHQDHDDRDNQKDE